MGGSSSNTNSSNWGITNGTSNQSPWSVQDPYLRQIFSDAKSQYDANMKQGPWQGDYLSPSTQQQRDQGQAVFSGADQNQAQNNDLTNTSQQLMHSGQGWMQDAAGTMHDLSGDQTQNVIDRAHKYQSGFDLQGQTDAAMRAANRNAAESTIPNLYRSAASAGGLNSDRAALQQGVVDRGLQTQAMDTYANLSNNTYQSGINTAEGDLNRQLSSAGALGSMGQNAVNMGDAGINSGINNQGKIDTRRMAAADYIQALNQNDLSNSQQKFQGGQNFGWGQLGNLYNIIGNRSWGGTNNYSQTTMGGSSSQTQSNPGLTSMIGGGLGALGSLVGTGSGGGGGLIGGFRQLFS
jgi:hypothetical protein